MSAHVERMLRRLHDVGTNSGVQKPTSSSIAGITVCIAGRVWFDRDTRGSSFARLGIGAFVWQGSLLSLPTAPVIYHWLCRSSSWTSG